MFFNIIQHLVWTKMTMTTDKEEGKNLEKGQYILVLILAFKFYVATYFIETWYVFQGERQMCHGIHVFGFTR